MAFVTRVTSRCRYCLAVNKLELFMLFCVSLLVFGIFLIVMQYKYKEYYDLSEQLKAPVVLIERYQPGEAFTEDVRFVCNVHGVFILKEDYTITTPAFHVGVAGGTAHICDP